MTYLRLTLAAVVTIAHGVWIYLIGRQYLPMLLFASGIILFGLSVYLMWPKLQKMSLWLKMAVGAGIGYVASIISVAVVILILYGADQFIDRFFPSSLYVYPAISLGWLYGAFVVAAVDWRHELPKGDVAN